MAKKIFINLPVSDLNKSKQFFTAIGFSINQQFTDETAACVVISEDIYAMILTHEKFKSFTSKTIADATNTTEVITALSMDSRHSVDEIATLALEAGGTESRPVSDYGFMYTRTIDDLDGHTWEFFWMDPDAVNKPE